MAMLDASNTTQQVCVTTLAQAPAAVVAMAKHTAAQWQLEYTELIGSGLALVQQASHLELCQLDEPKVGGVRVDFASDASTYRRLYGGGKKQAIAKAIGLKGKESLRVIDATAGLGGDAFVLASLGCQVHMIERSSVVAALLADGLLRAGTHSELASWLPPRLQLTKGVASQLLANWPGEPPDVVYLDPMFPHRKKNAAVKKEMRLFQQLLGPDEDADLLLEPACLLAKHRVVVKRPAGAPYLAGQKPQIEMLGKANRFDVYLINP
jgi:16S rRNA (guanine1516-N2)-methyltransferase